MRRCTPALAGAVVFSLAIALGLGAGSEGRRPQGLAVVGGLILSQLLTLYITPVISTSRRCTSASSRAARRASRLRRSVKELSA